MGNPAKIARPCVVCGRPTRRAGSRCEEHPKTKRADHRWVYRDRRWLHVRERVLRKHRARWGELCLGDDSHERHVATPDNPLTVDHVIPLIVLLPQGGDPFDIRNLAVRCRSWNSQKDAGWAGLR